MNISRKSVNIVLLMLVFIALVSTNFLIARDNTTRSPGVPGGGAGGGDAETIDGIDSPQFLRSDVGDTHGGGTLSIGTVDIDGGNIDGVVLSNTSLVNGDFAYKSDVTHDVRAYGAICDGIIDDTVAIQAAVDAAKAYSRPVEVFFPKGKYLITSPIVIDRRVNLTGVGRGTQIYQSTDNHLFDIVPYGGNACDNMHWCNLTLGSAATTAGKALINMAGVGRSRWENIYMVGGHTGVRMSGCHQNTFVDLHAHANPGFFFGSGAAVTYHVHSHTSNSNVNTFIGAQFDWNFSYGFYWEKGNVLTIVGCTAQGTTLGCYFNGEHSLSIMGMHLEGGTASLVINGTSRATLINVGTMNTTLNGCNLVTLDNVKCTGTLTVDSNCHSIEANGVRAATFSIAEGTTHLVRTLNPAGNTQWEGGVQLRTTRNLVDGDLETWSGGLPATFSKYDSGQATAPEAAFMKFGTYSAKTTVGAGRNKSGLFGPLLDYDNLKGRRVTISGWVYRPLGSTADPYLCMYFAGGNYSHGFTILDDTWTRIRYTFKVRVDKVACRALWASQWSGAGTPGDVCYWDGLEVTIGDAASPLFDESMKADFGSSGGVGLPVYTDVGRPGANSVPAGFMIWNSDGNTPNFSDNSRWRSDKYTVTKVVGTSNVGGASGNYEKADYICDGTNDQVEIQAAVDALPPGDGKVVLLEGEYVIADRIVLDSNQTLSGMGYATHIHNIGTTYAAVRVIGSAGVHKENVVVSNIRITGVKGSSPGIYFYYCDYCRVIDNWVENTGDEGIYFNLSTYCTAKGNKISGGWKDTDGIKLVYTDYSIIIGNNIKDMGSEGVCPCTSDGIELEHSEYNAITGNVIEGGNEYGISLESTSQHNSLVGNVIKGVTSTGINIASSIDNLVSSNIIEDSGATGIVSYTGAHGTVVSGNKITNPDGYGIWVKGANYTSVSGNVVRGDGDTNYGILLAGASYGVVSGNVVEGIADTNASGIYLSSGSSENVVMGNISRDCTVYEFRMSDDSNNNVIMANNFFGQACNFGTATGNLDRSNLGYSPNFPITAVGNTITRRGEVVRLNPNGDYTLTSTPTIPNGVEEGDTLTFIAASNEAHTVTIQDQGTLAGSNLQLGAATRAITGGKVLALIWDGTDWIEVSYANN